MSVIPLTLIISLCLVFTFVVFFLREHARSRASSPERDSMLPFSEEKHSEATMVIDLKNRTAPEKPYRHAHGVHRHGPEGACENKPDHARCSDCPSRKAKTCT